MRRVLVDTSAWIDALRTDGDTEIRAAVKFAVAEDRAVFCDIVLLELWTGARGQAEHDLLRDLERDIETVATSPEVWAAANRLARLCRARGVTVPATDILVAASAQHHKLDLLHNDRHFKLIGEASRGAGDPPP